MHPNTNSSNWLVKSFSCCLYISEGCKNQGKAIYVSCTVSYCLSACVVTGKGVQSSAGPGESYGEAQLCDVSPDAVPPRAQGSAQPSSLSWGMFLQHLQPGAVKPLQG